MAEAFGRTQEPVAQHQPLAGELALLQQARQARSGDGRGLWLDRALESGGRRQRPRAPLHHRQRLGQGHGGVGGEGDPLLEGTNLRIPIPPLTEERRKELAKIAGKYAEQQKIAVRNVRRDANDDLKKAEKNGAINQDDQKRMETEVQKMTDEAIKRVDEALKTKEQEIMQV